MNKTKSNIKKIVWGSLAFSFLFHVVLLPSEMTFLSKIDLSKIKEKKETRIKLRISKKKSNAQQIVTTQKRDVDVDTDAKFLSEHTNRTERQTKARVVGAFNKAGAGNANINSKAQKKQPNKVVENKKKLKKKKGEKISFKDFSFTKNTNVTKDAPRLIKGQKNGDKTSRGVAKNNDFLEEVPLGDMTQLNTKEYKYYGFYFRIKQRLEQHWGKSLQDKMKALYRRNGRFPASEKHITSLRVDLDDNGNIVRIHLKGSSGVKELDDAAVESFNNAGPFPNPPKGMVRNGKASIEWGFAVSNS